MARRKKTFEEMIIDGGRRRLLQKLEYSSRDMYNMEESKEPEVYITYSRKNIEKVWAQFDAVVNEGKRRNVEVYLNSKYPNRLYFRYIFYRPLPEMD